MRWLASNIRTFALAFVLALAVWVSSVTAADPNEVQLFPRPVPIEFVGQAPSLVIVGNPTRQLSLTLRAPRSVWERLTSREGVVRAVVDLAGLEAGTHRVEVRLQIDERPVQIVSRSVETLEITLEPFITRSLPVTVGIVGDLPPGFQAGEMMLEPSSVVVSGPQSQVERVESIVSTLNITGVRETIKTTLSLRALAADGQLVNGISITPDSVALEMPISQQGGYRDLAVKVATRGQVASGYRLTSIAVFPPVVTLYSSDPELVARLPGFVETQPLDLTNARDDIEIRLALVLPEGVSLVGEQAVLVQAVISPILSSITLTNKRVEVIGLGRNLGVTISPDTVDVILSGPLPVLETLNPNDVRVVVDLTGLIAGSYKLTPRIEILLEDIRTESINPSTVEVTIIPGAPTPTPVRP